jgi:hypothetical protein
MPIITMLSKPFRWLFRLKTKIFLVLVMLVLIGLAGYKFGFYSLPAGSRVRPERGLIMSKLVAMKEINRLYTGFYMVPVIDISYGDLKSDVIKQIVVGSGWPKAVPKGYCLKKYDVGFGYDNVLDLLQDESFMEQVCAGDPSALPAPRLLSLNGKTAEINGDYQGGCREWDLDRNQKLRRSLIYRELNEGAALKKINAHGQKSLHSLASPLCR